MDRRMWYQRFLCMLAVVLVLYTGFVFYCFLDQSIPDRIHLFVNEEDVLEFSLPLQLQMQDPLATKEVALSGVSNIPPLGVSVLPDHNDGFSVLSDQIGTYTLQTKLLGILPMKSIEVSVIDRLEVIPCGFPVGIYLETDGVLVVGTAKVTDDFGMIQEPAYAVLQTGDYIVSVNGKQAVSKQTIIDEVRNSQGNMIHLAIRRNGQLSNVALKPIWSQSSEYQLGIWVRDDAQGIGTITYLTADGSFGALGHGVSDVDTGELLEISEGKLYTTKILSIIKGSAGIPGGLSGVINYDNESLIGKIQTNSTKGIYGVSQELLESQSQNGFMQIGLRQEVELGQAYIQCELNGERKEYEIEITKLDDSPHSPNKGMEIQVIDPELLEKTNGIVQGMSGSPIIQNGKIIGAVTHVFVQDSTKGYGIFIENMLSSDKHAILSTGH